MLEMAGHRYYAAQVRLSVGDVVTIEAEPGNQHDPNAVVMRVAGRTTGYINRLQATAFQQWLSEREVSAVIERLNGQPRRPRAFVFLITDYSQPTMHGTK
jgi:HIRAN domain